MFEWPGEKHGDEETSGAGAKNHRAVESVLVKGRYRTPDLRGKSTTRELGDAGAERAAKAS